MDFPIHHFRAGARVTCRRLLAFGAALGLLCSISMGYAAEPRLVSLEDNTLLEPIGWGDAALQLHGIPTETSAVQFHTPTGVDLGLRLNRPWAGQLFAGVGMASFASFSYFGEVEPAPIPSDIECGREVCAQKEELDPVELSKQQRRELLRGISLGVGIAALSGALWLTVSHDPTPNGHTTRLGFRPVAGGSVALVGGRF